MDEGTLKRLLRAGEPTRDRSGWRCPSDTELASYVEQRVSADERARIESHLADCDACLDQVACLARLPDMAPVPAVSPALLSRAERLGATARRGWPAPVLRWGSLAAAACLIVAVGLHLRQASGPVVRDAPGDAAPAVPQGPSPQPSVALPAPAARSPAAPPPAAVRRSSAARTAVSLISPRENATLPAQNAVFVWQAVSGALYYELQVVTGDGTVVWQVQADPDATRVRLPSDHPLQTGAKYFVWVRAHLASGGTVRSAAVSFNVGKQ